MSTLRTPFRTALRAISITGLLASGLASADTVSLTTVTEITVGSHNTSISSNGGVGFGPPGPTITFKLGSKTCNFISSYYGAGYGSGCNYALTYNASTGALSNPWSNGNGCTPPSQMIAACQ